MTTNSSLTSASGPRPGPCDIHINSFLAHLRGKGYAKAARPISSVTA